MSRWPSLRIRRIALLVLLASQTGLASGLQTVTKEDVAGIRNFTRVDATVACAGATDPSAMAELKRQGFAAVINLRLADEKGADLDASRAAAEAAGLRWLHIPFNHRAPDPSAVDAFLAALTDPANSPVLIHCGSGERAATMWMIKRVLRDGWSVEDALKEAQAIGLKLDSLREFALKYIDEHRQQM
jgi:uncharacterized protein (TIGR01244 family)